MTLFRFGAQSLTRRALIEIQQLCCDLVMIISSKISNGFCVHLFAAFSFFQEVWRGRKGKGNVDLTDVIYPP
jgi:hypothetical protein